MFYRFINNDTQEICVSPSVRTLYHAISQYRRQSFADGEPCREISIQAIPTADPFIPAIRTICTFPAFDKIPGTLYDSGDLSVRGYNGMRRAGVETNAEFVSTMCAYNAGLLKLNIKNVGRRTFAEWERVARNLIKQPFH